ncbi:hypothetical protein LS74_001710 [Helicobacter magdeburgensis]|uniref:Uncharacterized protein n=1 Tax=Helicobacter magdeburgensis TaxID=471858 RepID=A0A4U8T1Y2_9HELI|nr:hypothetical protein [Helicobacter magdeburgensis]TLD93469.1 hypothetical protein LS74_001710 [Helicobacter magdeburgensis]
MIVAYYHQNMVELTTETLKGVSMKMPLAVNNHKEESLQKNYDSCKNELRQIMISKRGEKGEQDFNALMKRIENKEAWNEAYKILAQDEEWNKEEKWLGNVAVNDGIE